MGSFLRTLQWLNVRRKRHKSHASSGFTLSANDGIGDPSRPVMKMRVQWLDRLRRTSKREPYVEVKGSNRTVLIIRKCRRGRSVAMSLRDRGTSSIPVAERFVVHAGCCRW